MIESVHARSMPAISRHPPLACCPGSAIGPDIRLQSIGARESAGAELAEVIHAPAPDVMLGRDRAGVCGPDVGLGVVDAEVGPGLFHLPERARGSRSNPVAAQQVAPGVGETGLRAILESGPAIVDL